MTYCKSEGNLAFFVINFHDFFSTRCAIHQNKTDSYTHLGLIFNRTLKWHHHILSIKQKTSTFKLNRIKQLSHLIPRKVLYTLYVSCVLPILDYGNVIFANCSTLDSSLLENIHAKAAKIILGCFRASRNAAVLSDLNFIPLSTGKNSIPSCSFMK